MPFQHTAGILAAGGSGASLSSSANAIPSRLLGGVKTRVGGANQVVPCGAMVWKGGHSRADGNGSRDSRKLPLLNCLTKFLGHAEGMVSAGLGQQDSKLLPAIPAYHVNLAQLLVED
jgi:hypothetical protein